MAKPPKEETSNGNTIVGDMSESDTMRIGYNVETMLDNFTGQYHTGTYGEKILSGGAYSSVLITGRGNTIKSTTGLMIQTRVMDRYPSTSGTVNDTEDSIVGIFRVEHLSASVAPRLVRDRAFYNTNLFKISNSSSEKEPTTTKWFDGLSARIRARMKKNVKADYTVTPFLDPMDETGKTYVKRLKLVMPFMDSMSKATIDLTQEIIDKAATDSSDQNIITARENLIKARMMREIPRLAGAGGTSWIITAHMGDKMQMMEMGTPQSKLAFINAKVTLKHAPEPVTFLTTYILYSNHLKPLMENKTDPLYPEDDDFGLALEKDVDLMELHMMTLRSKVGLTGVEWCYVVSQSDGYKIPLSHFHFIKKYKFGLDGLGGTWLNLHLLPDVKISRTTINAKIAAEARLTRALEITTAIMIQIITGNREFKADFAKIGGLPQLYQAIIDKGYDWEEIYQTRDWWAENHYTNEVKYLSAWDIVRMATGDYIPYWKQPGFDVKNHKEQ